MAPNVVCYVGTWAHYRPGNGKFEIANIDPHLCTHLIYAFFGITHSAEITYLDKWLDIDLGYIAKMVELKKKNRNLKVLAAVGGWNQGSLRYSAMAANAGKRHTFINSAIKLLHKHGFDGLDLDWEYPAQRGGSAADRANFVVLLKEIKEAFHAQHLLLTIAVGASAKTANISYDIAHVAQHVDLINLMSYDFSGSWDRHVGFNAPLKGAGENVEAAVDFWLKHGAPADKIMMGIPFYGRTFTLTNSAQHNPGASCTGAGNAGPYTRQRGTLGYNEIVEESASWTKQWDNAHEVPYAYHGNQWISYDDTKSIAKKVDFIKQRRLGGAMIWSLETDDFHGKGGEAYPLLKAINKTLHRSNL